ncbi:adipokinetic hormone/corazonin-related peptide receptor variant I [Papilio machaon]|uniref:adipokinetic hormone/corazonin-related peptide receptor variant I n=1 Tax=Papilio machaon TaxID=76193 RepID=UPI001E662C5A|nr:adipokinetic hormone/corazonin-related peptide receptor variant I [Papilio machaon]
MVTNTSSNILYTETSPVSVNKSIEESLARDQHAVIVTYWILMTLGAVGNLAVLVSLAKTRRRKSRVDLLMTHLAIADVSVTCGVIPLEIGWKYTNEWLAGNVLCKVLLVMRAFGLYLSSNVLVCISLDRFFAVLYPLKLRMARKRSQHMLYWAWAMALACSLPQSVVFRVLQHPQVPGFEQCVSFDAFESVGQEIAYNVSCLCAMYFVPLLVISVCYICIFCKIRRCSNELNENCAHKSEGAPGMRLRRSDHRLLERARRRTLRMTVIIVTVFALCWLPYAVMAMWYMIDRQSASRVSPQLQDLLFAMAVSNSCMNPLVYGSYALRSNDTFQHLVRKSCCWSSGSNNTGNTGVTSHRNKIRNFEDSADKLNKNGNPRVKLGVRFMETSLIEPQQTGEARVRRGPA